MLFSHFSSLSSDKITLFSIEEIRFEVSVQKFSNLEFRDFTSSLKAWTFD